MQGFEAETVRDLLTGDYEVTRYETTWPKAGMVLRKDSYLSNGTPTHTVENTLKVSGAVSTGPAFPYVERSVETVYDDSRNPMITTTTDHEAPDPYGNFTQINVATSDAAGRVSSTQETTHTYDAADTANWILGRLNATTVVHSATGSSILLGSHTATKKATFTYHPNGLLKSELVEAGHPDAFVRSNTTYTYDAYGHKATVSVSGNGNGNAGSTLLTRVTQNAVAFFAVDELVTTTTNAAGHVSKQWMSLIHGGVMLSQDPNGQQISVNYDAFGRKIRQSQGAVFTDWTYDWANGEVPNAVQKITTQHSTGARTVVYQDLMGRPVRQSKLGLGGREIHEDTIYDAQGRVVEARRPSFASEVGASVITRYDDRGRIIEIESPGPNGSRITTRYGYSGLDTTITDPLGRTRTERRNGVGKTEQIVDAGGASMFYSYDSTGNLVKTVDPIGQATSITYDVLGRKLSMLDPHMGEWRYEYNSFGELEQQTDAKGQVTVMQYDTLGRMVSRTEPGDSQPSTWTYDSATYGKGLLASVQGQLGYREVYAYNNKSLPHQVTTSINYHGVLESFVVSTQYDDQNRVWKITQPLGFVTENVYDAYGHMVALRSPEDAYQEVDNDDALPNRINEILSILPGYQSAANSLAAQVSSYELAAEELEADAVLLEADTLNGASQADRDYIAQARATAALYHGYASIHQTSADRFRADAQRLDGYADFYTSLEDNAFLSATHWTQLFAIRQVDLAAQASQLNGYANTAEAVASGLDDEVTRQTNLADAREAQVLAQVRQDIDDLLEQAETAAAQAEVFRAQSIVAAAELARLQSQLAMLQTNQNDSANVVWWRADQTDAEGRVTQEVLGNGLLTRRDYDPATGHLLTIQTGGSIFEGAGVNANNVQDVGYRYDAMNNVTHRWDHNVQLHAEYGYDDLDRLQTAQSFHSTIAKLNTSLAWGYDDAGYITYRG